MSLLLLLLHFQVQSGHEWPGSLKPDIVAGYESPQAARVNPGFQGDCVGRLATGGDGRGLDAVVFRHDGARQDSGHGGGVAGAQGESEEEGGLKCLNIRLS